MLTFFEFFRSWCFLVMFGSVGGSLFSLFNIKFMFFSTDLYFSLIFPLLFTSCWAQRLTHRWGAPRIGHRLQGHDWRGLETLPVGVIHRTSTPWTWETLGETWTTRQCLVEITARLSSLFDLVWVVKHEVHHVWVMWTLCCPQALWDLWGQIVWPTTVTAWIESNASIRPSRPSEEPTMSSPLLMPFSWEQSVRVSNSINLWYV